MSGRPLVLVHGGAGRVPDALHDACRSGTRAAATAVWAALAAGGDCVDAAVAAVRVLEDAPAFNAGRGACLNADAQFEVDAAIMRGRDLAAGAVAGVANLADPILVARELLEHSRHTLLVGLGAERWARARGVGRFGREALITAKALDRYARAVAGEMARDGRADTVGAVVLDAAGDLAAAGSTGGVLLKLPGRVGDTPLVGPGLYAHPELGAAAATGEGEAIMAYVMAYEVLRRIEGGDEAPPAVARRFCEAVRAARRAAVGLIGIDRWGHPFVAHACRHMSWALAEPDTGAAEAAPFEVPPRLRGGLHQEEDAEGGPLAPAPGAS